MSKNPSTTKLTKIVGSETYINQKTGEITEMQVIQVKDADANFHKIWLAHMMSALDMIGNQKIRVLEYLLSNMSKDNQVVATQRKIAKELGISVQTVSFTLTSLKEANFLTSSQQGVYRLNPNAIFKGYNSSRMNVLIQYSNEAAEETNKKASKKKKKDLVADDEPIPGQIDINLMECEQLVY